MLTNAPKGTKDVLPEQGYRWDYVEKAFSDVCRRFGFDEIRTPMFEHTELFARGVGDSSDIVEKQMYTFEDYGGRSLTLRPEGTAGVVRAFVEHKLYAGVLPAKLWYRIPCFRYEKPQSGRLREFHQLGIEVFGSADMLADTEVIALADAFFRQLRVTGISLRVNSIGCPVCRQDYRKALMDFFRPKYDELCDTCKSRFEKNPMRILDCKSPVCQKLAQGAPLMLDYLCEDCTAAFVVLRQDLTAAGIAYEVDPTIVRGLDYYTKTAFEFVTGDIGAQGTVCGGGRYDHLIETVGGPGVPGVGFGLGIERLLLLMENLGIEIPRPEGPDAFIAFLGEAARGRALALLRELREKGIAARLDIGARNLKGQFKYADRLSARYTLVLGEEELTAEVATVKDMKSGNQRKVPLHELAAFLAVSEGEESEGTRSE